VGSTWVSGKEGIQEILQCVPFLYSLHFEPGADTMYSKTKFKFNKPKLDNIAKLRPQTTKEFPRNWVL
jgi:hypothetical protein